MFLHVRGVSPSSIHMEIRPDGLWLSITPLPLGCQQSHHLRSFASAFLFSAIHFGRFLSHV